jgi:hypothetical protein
MEIHMQTHKEVHPLPNLRKGYVLWNFIQIEFYISQHFPKFNSIEFFYLTCRKNYGSVLQNVQ